MKQNVIICTMDFNRVKTINMFNELIIFNRLIKQYRTDMFMLNSAKIPIKLILRV